MSGLMPWGKYRDWPLSDVPASYLAWCLEECDLKPVLREAIRRQLADRFGLLTAVRETRLAEKRGAIDGWYRSLCLDYHPDRGGSHEAMLAINDAHRRLKDLVTA